MRTSGGGGAPLSMALSAPHFSRLVTRESPFAPGLASWRPHGVAQFPGASVSRLTMSGCVLCRRTRQQAMNQGERQKSRRRDRVRGRGSSPTCKAGMVLISRPPPCSLLTIFLFSLPQPKQPSSPSTAFDSSLTSVVHSLSLLPLFPHSHSQPPAPSSSTKTKPSRCVSLLPPPPSWPDPPSLAMPCPLTTPPS